MADQRQSGRAVTIGFFDGVHLGHQALLARVRAAAERLGLEPLAVTFDLHSLEVLHGRGPLRTILTTSEKIEALKRFGVAEVKVYHFTPEFAAQTGAEFVWRHLHEELAARYIAVGPDFRFGHNRACGTVELRELAGAHGMEVDVVPRLDGPAGKVSSRDIRDGLLAGRVADASALLGRPYRLAGEVVEGRRLGRTIGLPTANLAVDPRKIVPADGVYAAWAEVDAVSHPAVVNIGLRPTVDGRERTIEAHLLEFTGDLYGRTVALEFIGRLRDEQRFDGLEALQGQINRDIAAARRLLEEVV